jgi:predicted glutamine amidotransferase
MCRLLYVRNSSAFSVSEHLLNFAKIARNSPEYQGHGWGCCYLLNNQWQIYKNIKPVWEDDLSPFGETTVLLAHARSAFRDQDIGIEFNMPYIKEDIVFIFNGELHGVKINEQGRIGAEKIFNFLLRFYRDDMISALQKGTEIIEKRSRYIKAMNIIIADRNHAWIVSQFNEKPEYFTMQYKNYQNGLIICSDSYPASADWQHIDNRTIKEF